MENLAEAPASDGTNCCTFLGLGRICNKILCETVNCRDVNRDRIVQISEEMICNLPLQIYGYRDLYM